MLSDIVKYLKSKNLFLFSLFIKPKLYLLPLIKQTFITGFCLLIFYELINHIGIKTQSIPSSIHSLIGFVIGLLLIFRVNTAYDRWWEARKIFSSIHASFLYFKIKSNSSSYRQQIQKKISEINCTIFEFVSTSDSQISERLKKDFLKSYSELTSLFCDAKFETPVYGAVERRMSDLIEYFSSLERIKNTPIPVSYSFHIKLSILLYLLTLPFGMFFELGVWSIPCVMVLFFIIAGIDIISSEIENPFHGDPNDLPIDEFEAENEKYINGQG